MNTLGRLDCSPDEADKNIGAHWIRCWRKQPEPVDKLGLVGVSGS
jgi:hypothetical protein